MLVKLQKSTIKYLIPIKNSFSTQIELLSHSLLFEIKYNVILNCIQCEIQLHANFIEL